MSETTKPINLTVTLRSQDDSVSITDIHGRTFVLQERIETAHREGYQAGRAEVLAKIADVDPVCDDRDEMGGRCLFCRQWKLYDGSEPFPHAPECLWLEAQQATGEGMTEDWKEGRAELLKELARQMKHGPMDGDIKPITCVFCRCEQWHGEPAPHKPDCLWLEIQPYQQAVKGEP